jgi:hypothetical protein
MPRFEEMGTARFCNQQNLRTETSLFLVQISSRTQSCKAAQPYSKWLGRFAFRIPIKIDIILEFERSIKKTIDKGSFVR